MTHHLSTWENDKSKSPGIKKSKNAKDKLKKLTTHLGNGASRNNASKGILTGSFVPKSYKRSKFRFIYSRFSL